MFYGVEKCRACGETNLVSVLDLGVQPLANNFISKGGECAGYAPLEILFCRNCTLAQLSVVVKPEILYRDYAYITSKTKMMFAHFAGLQADIEKETSMSSGDIKWLEIGSNDGTFMAQLPCHENHCLGIEPAKNLAAIANERGIRTIPQLFGEPCAIELASTGYRADVVVARHVFAHVDDWKGFIHALKFVTHKDSLVVIEVPWAADMLKMNSFDQIYHEHLSYVSIRAIHRLLQGMEFYVQRVEHYDIHGGAVGIFLRRRSEIDRNEINPVEEDDLEDQWRELDSRKDEMVSKLRMFLRHAKSERKTVCGFGASAKATVWCNTALLDKSDIAFVCDSTEQKQNKLIPGTSIPVVAEGCLSQADYAICFAWNFWREINLKFPDFKGHWITPVPEMKVHE